MQKPGLFSQAEQAATGQNPFQMGAAPAQSEIPAQAPNGKDIPISAENQEAYDSAMAMVGKILHEEDEASDGILDHIDDAASPAEGIAEATDLIFSQLEEAFAGQLPEELILHIGDEVTDLLLEMAEAAGIVEVTDEIYAQTKTLTTLLLLEEYGVDQADHEGVAANYAQEDLMSVETIITGAKSGGTSQ